MRREITISELEKLAAFSTWIEAPTTRFGRWTDHHFSLSDDAALFVKFCYDEGWVSGAVDWPTWKQTERAKHLVVPNHVLSEASAVELQCLLTTLIRQDRFVEGAINASFESGLLAAIVVRAGQLASG